MKVKVTNELWKFYPVAEAHFVSTMNIASCTAWFWWEKAMWLQ